MMYAVYFGLGLIFGAVLMVLVVAYGLFGKIK